VAKDKDRTKPKEGGIPAFIILPVAAGLGIAGVVMVAALAKAAPGPPPAGKANLYGTVRDADTSNPIVGAIITLDSIQTTSDSSGNYSFTDIDPDTYSISCTKDGFQTVSESITVAEGNNQVNIMLTPVGGIPPGVAQFEYVSVVRCIPDVRYTAGGAYMTHRVEVDVKNISSYAGSLNFYMQQEVSGLSGYPDRWFPYAPSKVEWLLPTDVGMAGILTTTPYVVNLNPGQTVTVAFAALVGSMFNQLRGTFISEAGTIVGTFNIGYLQY
jgi:hypothetical protein